MEYITPSQLESYESILDEINKEHEKSEQLNRQINKEDDKITALNIAIAQEDLREKMCATSVMIFNNVFEIYNLYSENFPLTDLVGLSKQNSCKYYVVEVLISKTILEKMLDSWHLHISIYNKEFNINKVLKLVNKVPIMLVIPVNDNVIESKLEVKLCSSSNGYFTTISLCNLELNVSYHFETYSGEESENRTLLHKSFNMSELYNNQVDLSALYKPMFFEYKVNCNVPKEQFARFLIQNSYHRLDIELFSELSNELGQPVNITFSLVGGNKCIARYDRKTGNVKLKGTAEDLYMIKKYILKEIMKIKQYTLHKDSSLVLKQLAEIKMMSSNDLSELKLFLQNIRSLVHQLPV